MIYKNCWRQPVPTDFLQHESFSYLEKMLLAIIFLEARREKETITRWNGNKQHTITLERGQCYLNMSLIARECGLDSRQIKKSLENLAEKYQNIENEMKTFGVIITVLDYDCAVKMENEMKTNGKRNENEMKSNIDKDRRDRKDRKTVKRKQDATTVAFTLEKKISEEAVTLTQDLWQRIQANNEHAQHPDLEKWADEMDKILRIDHRDLKTLRFLIQWSTQDSFWSTNILSPAKLRKHFEKLFLQARSEWHTKQKNSIPKFG